MVDNMLIDVIVCFVGVHDLPSRVNEVLFGVCSNDTLFALSNDQESKNPGHKMCRMAGHMLQQQSFSPSFPAPPSSLAQVGL
mmetsp:Transcript_1536/g.2889  ORF Transcript_1536/g.2889 Transcript_1536/m.2889 type:complete len:82 (-) Transcript_1536:1477-1722(-)